MKWLKQKNGSIFLINQLYNGLIILKNYFILLSIIILDFILKKDYDDDVKKHSMTSIETMMM